MQEGGNLAACHHVGCRQATRCRGPFGWCVVSPPGGTGNARNGSTSKTLITEHGQVQIDAPRDRNGSFEPKIVRKRQRRFEGLDEKILALYSRGLSTRDIEAHLAEIYGVSVGRDLISRVTDAVMDDARAWQTRPLEDVSRNGPDSRTCNGLFISVLPSENEEHSLPRQLGLCRPQQPHTPAIAAPSRPPRHNPDLGIVHVMPTSA